MTSLHQSIVATLTKLGWTVDLDTFDEDTPLGRKTFTNISLVMQCDVRRVTRL